MFQSNASNAYRIWVFPYILSCSESTLVIKIYDQVFAQSPAIVYIVWAMRVTAA